MSKRVKSGTAGQAETIAQAAEPETTTPGQAAAVNEADGGLIFHADEEAGDGDE